MTAAGVFWLVILAMTFTSIGILLGRWSNHVLRIRERQIGMLEGIECCSRSLAKHPKHVNPAVVRGIDEAAADLRKAYRL